MSKSIVLFSLLLFTSTFSQAKIISLTEAIGKGYVELSAEGEGGHTGKCLKLKIKNLQKKKLDIQIHAGLVFNSNDPGEQDLMITEERMLAIEGNENRIAKMYAACIQAPNGSPSLGSGFNISLLATGHLLQVAQYLAKEKLYKNAAAQYAVWAISNEKRIENIDHGELANYVADLLGKPRPEYVVVHRTTSSPGEPAYREAPSIIKGRWQFKTEQDIFMTFGLYTLDGELKHAFFENIKKISGLHKFSFTFKVFNMPQGEYYIRLISGDEVVEEKKIQF
ncbi:MAG: hypothetical protein ACI85O_003736 [Saprospiraceae bacterium]|jgi:hypothetical protein